MEHSRVPIISVSNETAVRLIIFNNTTQIFNIAVVSSLYNTSTSNVLFNSLSGTVNGGGTSKRDFHSEQSGHVLLREFNRQSSERGRVWLFHCLPLM